MLSSVIYCEIFCLICLILVITKLSCRYFSSLYFSTDKLPPLVSFSRASHSATYVHAPFFVDSSSHTMVLSLYFSCFIKRFFFFSNPFYLINMAFSSGIRCFWYIISVCIPLYFNGTESSKAGQISFPSLLITPQCPPFIM